MSESHIARLPLSDVPSAVLAHCPSALAGLPINVFPIPGHAELSDDFHAAPCILVAHDGHGQRWYRRGEQVKHLHTAPRMIEMYEKGLAFDHCRWVGQTGRTVSIEFLDEDVEALTHGELQTLNLPTRHELFDERLSRLTLDLAAEALCGMPSGQLFAQATSVALIATLASRYVDAVPAVPTRGRLAPLQQRRLVELIEHQVGADLSLTRMADEVGLSPHHFCAGLQDDLRRDATPVRPRAPGPVGRGCAADRGSTKSGRDRLGIRLREPVSYDDGPEAADRRHAGKTTPSGWRKPAQFLSLPRKPGARASDALIELQCGPRRSWRRGEPAAWSASRKASTRTPRPCQWGFNLPTDWPVSWAGNCESVR